MADYAELARLARITKARVSEIMNLLNLAPDIQEEILDLEPGRGRVTERRLRPIAAETNWEKQRRVWGALSGADGGSEPGQTTLFDGSLSCVGVRQSAQGHAAKLLGSDRPVRANGWSQTAWVGATTRFTDILKSVSSDDTFRPIRGEDPPLQAAFIVQSWFGLHRAENPV